LLPRALYIRHSACTIGRTICPRPDQSRTPAIAALLSPQWEPAGSAAGVVRLAPRAICPKSC